MFDDPSKGIKFSRGTISFAGKLTGKTCRYCDRRYLSDILSLVDTSATNVTNNTIQQEVDQTAGLLIYLLLMDQSSRWGHNHGYA